MPQSERMQRLAPVLAWIDSHRDAALSHLQQFCRQPSVAAQNWGMEEMAKMVAASLSEIGAETQNIATEGYPVIVGQLAGETPRRLAIYNHYDVQPPEPLDAWSFPPFDATIHDGYLYARGVADNKGNLVARLWAARAWREVYGTLPCQVTFLFEGEEEIGSPHLGSFAAANQDLIRADACLWETGYRDVDGSLGIYAGVKGILYIELRTRGTAYDLHSSNAPLAPNAVWRLLAALNALQDAEGNILIPHFYDDVKAPTEQERELMTRFPVNVEAYQKSWGSAILPGPAGSQATPTERLLYAPTCNICGIWGGYSGSGSKTIIPATAGVKIDFRLVPDQDPQKILDHLRRYLAEQGFSDVEVVELEGTEHPAQSPIDTPLLEALVRSAREIYGIEPRVQVRTAGTGPMEALSQRYGIPAIGGAGVGHSDSRTHAPDENIRVDDFILNIKHVAALLAEFAAM